ncbi:hypothetical protein BKA62DRAFT_829043 [Auriculariales sp. MPI-PUGE-AT-0066]|nr:hypothetical protein BKA62DRAFT_829043 [Auriculariales sp. MPI-PUGE-AT-0066]
MSQSHTRHPLVELDDTTMLEPVLHLRRSVQSLSIACENLSQTKCVRDKYKAAAAKLVATCCEIVAAVAAAHQQRLVELPILAKSQIELTRQFIDECVTYIQSQSGDRSWKFKSLIAMPSAAARTAAFVIQAGVLCEMLAIKHGVAQLVLDPSHYLGMSNARPELDMFVHSPPSNLVSQLLNYYSPLLSSRSTVYHGVKVAVQTMVSMTEGLPWPWKAIPQTIIQFVDMVETLLDQPRKMQELINTIGLRVSFLLEVSHEKGRENLELCGYVEQFLGDVQRVVLRLRVVAAVRLVKEFPLTTKISEIIQQESARMEKARQDLQLRFTAHAAFTSGATHTMVAEIHAKVVGSDVKSSHTTFVQATLPGRPRFFNGRDETMSDIVGLIYRSSYAARIIIMGAGGIGKTSLALAIAHQARVAVAFSDRRFFISVEGMIDVEAAAKELARAFGLQDSQDPLSATVHHLQASKPTLLIIDNLETLWFRDNAALRIDTERMLTRLADVSSLTLIITCRGAVVPSGVDWSNAQSAVILPISLEAALQTFTHIAGVPESGSELALRKNLPSDLLRRWRSAHTNFIQTPGNHRECSVDVSIKVSLDLLVAIDGGKEGLQLLSVCSHLPDGLRPPVFAQLCDTFYDIRGARDLLVELALVAVGSEGELRMLSPVRHYVFNNHTMTEVHTKLMRQIYFDIAKSAPQKPGDDFARKSAEFSPEHGNLTWFLLHLIHTDKISQDLCDAVHAVSEYAYWTVPSITLYEALRERLDEQPAWRARCLVDMSRTQSTRRGEYLQAAENLKIARGLQSKLGDAAMTARTTYFLGRALLAHGAWDAAQQELNAARADFIQQDYKIGAGRCAFQLGFVHASRANYDQAFKAFSTARDTFNLLGARLDIAQCTHGIGLVQLNTDDLDSAEKTLKTALSEFEALGSVPDTANCIGSLGSLRLRQKDFKSAERLFVSAREAFAGIGSISWSAYFTRWMADLHRDQGRSREALAGYQQVKTMYEIFGAQVSVEECCKEIKLLLPQAEGDEPERYDANGI